jgi:diguanylate cyclase (GGDEF)-like protein
MADVARVVGTEGHRGYGPGAVDALTGLPNRAAVEPVLVAQVDDGRPGVVMIVDLDHFKTINDRFGHMAGDDVLRTVANRLRALSPPEATVARVGGEEFAVLLPCCTLEEGRAAAERLRIAVRAPMSVAGTYRMVTASIGVARTPRSAWHHAFAVADRCLYQAKSSGRDQVLTEDELDDARAGRYDIVQQFHQMQDQRDALALIAITDDLTGLRNRRAFDSALLELHALSERDGAPYAVVYMDLDRFHDLNRARGDSAGDDALRACARALVDVCREGEVVYRKGGEELVALLPGTDLDGAMVLAERMRLAVIRLGVPYEDRHGSAVVTISGGVAAFSPDGRRSADDVVGGANRAMIRSKETGRDRMVAADATT